MHRKRSKDGSLPNDRQSSNAKTERHEVSASANRKSVNDSIATLEEKLSVAQVEENHQKILAIKKLIAYFKVKKSK